MNGRTENYDGNRDAGVGVAVEDRGAVDVADAAGSSGAANLVGVGDVAGVVNDAAAAGSAGAGYVVDAANVDGAAGGAGAANVVDAAGDVGATFDASGTDYAGAANAVGAAGEADVAGFVDVAAAADDGAVGYGEPNAYNLLADGDIQIGFETCFFETINLLFESIEQLDFALETGASPDTIANLQFSMNWAMNLCRLILTQLRNPIV